MTDGNITLNNWSLGMSADEYAGGSYFYAEGIDSYSNTRGFKLGHRIVDTEINKRTTGYPVAMEYVNELDEEGFNLVGMTGFTLDGYIESDGINRGSSTNATFGGALYKRPSGTYLNGTIASGQLLGITADKIDRITTTVDLFGTNVVANPSITSNTDWTVGAGWTTGTNGATHSSGGGVNTIRQTLTLTNGGLYRLTARVTGVTTGSCEVRLGTTVLGTITSASDTWFVATATAASTSENYTFIPTDTFNGTISYANAQEYDDAKMLPDDITITSASSHPLCKKQGLIYIASGSLIDIVDTSTWTVYDTVSIIDYEFTIRDITLSGNSIVIWASDGLNSKQYYRNGIDEVASEVIDWNGNNIVDAISDEVKTYVTTSNGWEKRSYVVEGYQRTRIANNIFNGRTIERGQNYYKPNKRFNFRIDKVNQTAILNDKLYINSYGGLYVYGSNIIGVQDSRSKPIIINHSTTTIYALQGAFGRLYIGNRKSSINYISQVYEYNYNPSGYLVTQAIVWDMLSSRKSLDQIKIGFKNVDSTIGNIKIYAIADDDYFRTFDVTGITTEPVAGDIYNVGTNTKAEVISTDITGGVGTVLLKTIDNTADYPGNALTTITKVSGTGQASITTSGFTNMALIRTIESTTQEYGNDFIFGEDFIDRHMPYWYKIQFVIELNSNNVNVSPEVYEITLSSSIIDKND